MRLPTHRSPTHPGEVLEQDFLKPLGMSQSRLSELTRMTFQRINQIINGKRGITPDTALRLSRLYGTSAEFWLNLQLHWDLWHAQREKADEIKRIRPLRKAS
jgi:addiction module HigA family antidote